MMERGESKEEQWKRKKGGKCEKEQKKIMKR